MSETCDVCRLPIDFTEWTCGNASVCAGANLANCYRLGYEREKALREDWQRIGEARLAEYEREKARAEKAEAEVKANPYGALFKQMRGERNELQAALAAARRECDRYRKLCAEARQWIEVGIPRSADRDSFLAALAASAAGDSK